MIRRPLQHVDFLRFYQLHRERPFRTIRVYSSLGFVPNSYRWRCEIEYIEYRDCYPEGRTVRGWTGAQRSFGEGPLEIVR